MALVQQAHGVRHRVLRVHDLIVVIVDDEIEVVGHLVDRREVTDEAELGQAVLPSLVGPLGGQDRLFVVGADDAHAGGRVVLHLQAGCVDQLVEAADGGASAPVEHGPGEDGHGSDAVLGLTELPQAVPGADVVRQPLGGVQRLERSGDEGLVLQPARHAHERVAATEQPLHPGHEVLGVGQPAGDGDQVHRAAVAGEREQACADPLCQEVQDEIDLAPLLGRGAVLREGGQRSQVVGPGEREQAALVHDGRLQLLDVDRACLQLREQAAEVQRAGAVARGDACEGVEHGGDAPVEVPDDGGAPPHVRSDSGHLVCAPAQQRGEQRPDGAVVEVVCRGAVSAQASVAGDPAGGAQLVADHGVAGDSQRCVRAPGSARQALCEGGAQVADVLDPRPLEIGEQVGPHRVHAGGHRLHEATAAGDGLEVVDREALLPQPVLDRRRPGLDPVGLIEGHVQRCVPDPGQPLEQRHLRGGGRRDDDEHPRPLRGRPLGAARVQEPPHHGGAVLPGAFEGHQTRQHPPEQPSQARPSGEVQQRRRSSAQVGQGHRPARRRSVDVERLQPLLRSRLGHPLVALRPDSAAADIGDSVHQLSAQIHRPPPLPHGRPLPTGERPRGEPGEGLQPLVDRRGLSLCG